MRIIGFALFVLLATGIFGSKAYASADSRCYVEWTLTDRMAGCDNIPLIAPYTDTRSNLLMLLDDPVQAGSDRNYIIDEWDFAKGRNFFDWSLLKQTFYPAGEGQTAPDDDTPSYAGSICQSYYSGSDAFNAAVKANRSIASEEKAVLMKARQELANICVRQNTYYYGEDEPDVVEDAALFAAFDVKSAAARDFLTYLKGAAAFYGDEFEKADGYFGSLSQSDDDWLRETALYMRARSELVAALEKAIGRYGDYDSDQVDKAAVNKAGQKLMDYLTAYPQGRYMQSARGLKRRYYWLAGDDVKLAAEYQKLLANPSLRGPAVTLAEMIEEIDGKALFQGDVGQHIGDANFLATSILLQMREEMYRDDEMDDSARKAQRNRLTKLRDKFAANPELYDYLLAVRSFYIEKDYKTVLGLIPDDARQDSFSHLQFSRQMLRGLALNALGDRNEAGFWIDMLSGTKALYQRPTVELALALNYERKGQIDKIFTVDSPVQETGIRSVLLSHVAGRDLLRSVAADDKRPKRERDLALFTLLFKQLTRGNYTDFLTDQNKIPSQSNTDAGLWYLPEQAEIPVGLFGSGAQQGEFSCPALRDTVSALAKNSKSRREQLCLADFIRFNGFDDFDFLDRTPAEGHLGSGQSQFPGKPFSREVIYTDIISDPKAAAEEKAYALYRLVYCYKGISVFCGGKVDLAQRKAWFQRLKSDYPNSEWARKLKYYW